MASKLHNKGTLKRAERPSKQELEGNPAKIVQTPYHYGLRLRRTTEPRRPNFLSSSSESPSTSPAISANLPFTNYELDHEDQTESLAPNTNRMAQVSPQNSERSIAPWVLTSRLHMPKKSIDVEFITRLADIRRQANGASSTSSSPASSLALLGSCVSIRSSAFSHSFSVLPPPPAVEFPPTPVCTDGIPAGLMEKLEILPVEQTHEAPALKNSYYPLQKSHTVIATRSLDTTHEVDSSTSTSSSPNSTPRQQFMQRPAPTEHVLYYAPNPSHSTPPRQTKIPTQTTPSSIISQQPSSLTYAPTATPRIGNKPLPLPPVAPYHFPPPMISPEHLVKFPKGDTFKGPYRALNTADHPIFRRLLKESLRRASCQISTPLNANGDIYVWGYIPIVIAKCGYYLEENATEIPGIFSVSGYNRRVRDLQAAFENPPRYGRSLDWKKESYTTHDIASVFRRYLAQMPEPVIPYDMYHPFRDAFAKEPFNREQLIATYKSLIRCLPRANQYLLSHVLDLLKVFASKCEKNLMTATTLAFIFRPSFISHPQHEMSRNYKEHALSQKVLEFLIVQQDSFMSDVLPPISTEPW